jgi:hypothetical protein
MVPPVVQVLRVPDSTSHGDVELLTQEEDITHSAQLAYHLVALLHPQLVYFSMCLHPRMQREHTATRRGMSVSVRAVAGQTAMLS